MPYLRKIVVFRIFDSTCHKRIGRPQISYVNMSHTHMYCTFVVTYAVNAHLWYFIHAKGLLIHILYPLRSAVWVASSLNNMQGACTGAFRDTRHPIRSWESGCAAARNSSISRSCIMPFIPAKNSTYNKHAQKCLIP